MAPADPLTGETASQIAERERTQTELLQRSMEEQRERAARNREMGRLAGLITSIK